MNNIKMRGCIAAMGMLVTTSGLCADEAVNNGPSSEKSITVILNSIKESCRADDKCGLVVTFANMTSNVIYIIAIDKPSFSVQDEKGNEVEDDVLYDPQPSPLDHYMQHGEDRVLMMPVWRLDPCGGVAIVVSDALKGMHKYLKKGKYTIRLPLTAVPIYKQDDVVVRENLVHKTWGSVDTAEMQTSVIQMNATVMIE
jgi:hypothetical protein